MTAVDTVNSTLLRNKRLKGFEQVSDFGVDVLANMMKEYARLKCLEAIKNVRHKSCEIVLEHQDSQFDIDRILNFIERDIQNIPNKDVMPEL